jgi:hypothetical protein
MMKKIYSAVAAGTAVAAVTLGATGASAATATANASANIVQAITITEDDALDFATIVPGAAASTVQISAAGARTCGAGLTCSGTHSAGNFTASGTANQPVAFGVDASTTLTSGANSMSVTGLALSAATGTTDAGGDATFSVGGTLNVGANQAAGLYTGTYNVSANYQ